MTRHKIHALLDLHNRATTRRRKLLQQRVSAPPAAAVTEPPLASAATHRTHATHVRPLSRSIDRIRQRIGVQRRVIHAPPIWVTDPVPFLPASPRLTPLAPLTSLAPLTPLTLSVAPPQPPVPPPPPVPLPALPLPPQHDNDVHRFTSAIRQRWEQLPAPWRLHLEQLVPAETWHVLMTGLEIELGNAHHPALTNMKQQFHEGMLADPQLPGLNSAMLLQCLCQAVYRPDADASLKSILHQVLDEIGSTCIQGISHRLWDAFVALCLEA